MSIVSPKVPDDNILTIFQLALDRLTSKPLDIFPITSNSFQYLGSLTFLFVIAIAAAYVNEDGIPIFRNTIINIAIILKKQRKKTMTQKRRSI